MLHAAMEQVLGPNILTFMPTVTSSLGDQADGASGFTYEAVLAAPTAPVEQGVDMTETKRNIDAMLARMFASLHSAPKVKKEDIALLEKCIKRLGNDGLTFTKSHVSWSEAWALFAHNPLKLQAMLAYADDAQGVPLVRLEKTNFVDLWPWNVDEAVLLRKTKPVKAVKVLGWSAASLPPELSGIGLLQNTQPMLRIRAISFPSNAALQAYNTSIAESEKSDHRLLGIAQSLFFSHESSPGSPFVMPHGMRLIRKVERVIRDLYAAFGYEEVQTPQLYRSTLWKQSGHWDKYREDMFSAKGFADEPEEHASCGAHDHQANLFGLKPMNCPGHCVMFAHQPRSYRELPLRLAEFSPLHRNEASGALSGLTRVRRFHQDDAHVFCTADQVGTEIQAMLHMLALAYGVFGFGNRFELVLSTRPDNFIGDIGLWEQAEDSLKQALEKSGRAWALNQGDGAFYGPKIDIRLVDAMGRKHQTATIQLDFQLPERFQLEYAVPEGGSEGQGTHTGHARPVMIHRAILGSFERFLAILLEQCRGWWPFWMSPRQAVVIPTFSSTDTHVQDKILAHAKHVHHALSHGGKTADDTKKRPFLSPTMADHALQVPTRSRFDVELPTLYLDPSGDTLGKKVRQAQLHRYNFMLIVGEQEAGQNTVSLRIRDERNAPAWHTSLEAENMQGSVPKAKVQDMILDAMQATFPDKFAADWTPSVDLGQWSVPELHRLFGVLDALHV
ncbi:threonine--tRNA ligase [Malassezia vespertilionis]|nr:threonine--tRNA ligase [Malassezia vespertilionis]WFD05363.1 threonine--tRNA ligase [Malassezia vespertilionis]